MSRPFIKTSIVATVSLALLYYSVARAILRCAHQENHLDHERVVTISDHHAGGFVPMADIDHLGYVSHHRGNVCSLSAMRGERSTRGFGDNYGRYMAATPAFFPRLSDYRRIRHA